MAIPPRRWVGYEFLAAGLSLLFDTLTFLRTNWSPLHIPMYAENELAIGYVLAVVGVLLLLAPTLNRMLDRYAPDASMKTGTQLAQQSIDVHSPGRLLFRPKSAFARKAASWLIVALGVLVGLLALSLSGQRWIPNRASDPYWYKSCIQTAGICLLGMTFIVGSLLGTRNRRRGGLVFLILYAIRSVLYRLSGCRFLGLGKGRWHLRLPISPDRTWFDTSVLCSLCRAAIRDPKQETRNVSLPDFGSSCESSVRQVPMECLTAPEARRMVSVISCVWTFLVGHQEVGLASSARTATHITKEPPWERFCDVRGGCDPRRRRHRSNDGVAIITLGARLLWESSVHQASIPWTRCFHCTFDLRRPQKHRSSWMASGGLGNRHRSGSVLGVASLELAFGFVNTCHLLGRRNVFH